MEEDDLNEVSSIMDERTPMWALSTVDEDLSEASLSIKEGQ